VKIDDIENSLEKFKRNPKKTIGLLLLALIVSILLVFIFNYFGKKGEMAAVKSGEDTLRPYLTIRPDSIEYTIWTEIEKKEDPEITNKCEKILLYFMIHNSSEVPATNVDISAVSYIIEEKDLGGFHPANMRFNYQHNIHLIEKNEPGRQPFLLALDKNAVKYFKDGTIKVKLIIKAKYGELKGNNKYWIEEGFIYSPTFRNQAKEIYSKGG